MPLLGCGVTGQSTWNCRASIAHDVRLAFVNHKTNLAYVLTFENVRLTKPTASLSTHILQISKSTRGSHSLNLHFFFSHFFFLFSYRDEGEIKLITLCSSGCGKPSFWHNPKTHWKKSIRKFNVSHVASGCSD